MRHTTGFSRSSAVLAAALLLSVVRSADGQFQDTGVIAGIVSDSSGAPIAGAEVSLV